MTDDDTFAGLSADQQLTGIALVGITLLVVGYASSSTIDPSYDPTLVAIGWVCLGYAGLRAAYARVR